MVISDLNYLQSADLNIVGGSGGGGGFLSGNRRNKVNVQVNVSVLDVRSRANAATHDGNAVANSTNNVIVAQGNFSSF